MSDDPQTPGILPGASLPSPAVPIVRPAGEDPDLPGTAREVATSIGTLVAEVHQLNARLEENAQAAERLDTRMSKGERALHRAHAAVAVIVVIGFLGTLLAYQVFETSACQATANDAFIKSANQSRDARDRQDDRQIILLDQQLALFDTVLNPASTAEQRLAASLAYREAVLSSRTAIRDAKQTRIDNPLPAGNCS